MSLKATVGKNSKRELVRACEVIWWLTVLSRSQYGTDISRKYFRDALW